MTESNPSRWTERLHAALSRRASGGRVVLELEGLRFLAIGGVMLYHLTLVMADRRPDLDAAFDQHFLHELLRQGRYGVQLFFMISGFVLALPFAERAFEGRPSVPLRDYLMRRVTRLEPPYILNMIASYALQAVFMGHAIPLSVLFASLFYLHTFLYGSVSPVNNVSWSLEVEVQFYLLAPLAAQIFRVRSTALRRASIVAFIVANSVWQAYFVGLTDNRVSLGLLYQASFFATGFLLCDVYLVSWRRAATRSWPWDLVAAAAALVVLAMPAFVGELRGERMILPWALAVFGIAAFRSVALNTALQQRWIVVIGGMCYTLYLYHLFVMSLAARVTTALSLGSTYAGNLLLQGALLFPIVLATGAVLFVTLEKPFMGWRWRSGPRVAPAA